MEITGIVPSVQTVTHTLSPYMDVASEGKEVTQTADLSAIVQ